MRRRTFLKAAAASGAALAGGAGAVPLWAEEALRRGPRSNAPRLPLREYGRTGVKLSVLGFPGFALRDLEMDRVHRMVGDAIDRGMNYFDVAPSYGDAEERLGPALEPYRKEVFLACKTAQRTAEGAAADLRASLEKLRTDHFDLYQLHHIHDMEKDVEVAFGKGGAMETLIQAKKEGKVRYLGFSAHSVEAALAAMDRYDFDSALVPINFACMQKGKWGPQIIEKARDKGVVLLALKPLARQRWPKDAMKHEHYKRCWYQPITDLDEAYLSLRYTLSQPVTAAIPPAAEFLFRPALNLAMDYTPIEPQEVERLRALAEHLEPVFAQPERA